MAMFSGGDWKYEEPFLALYIGPEGDKTNKFTPLEGKPVYVQEFHVESRAAEYFRGRYYHITNCEHNDKHPIILDESSYQSEVMCLRQALFTSLKSNDEGKIVLTTFEQ